MNLPAADRSGPSSSPRNRGDGQDRIPIPVLLLVIVALAVVGVILGQAAVGILYGLVRLILIMIGFVAIGVVGLFLWRRGDVSRTG